MGNDPPAPVQLKARSVAALRMSLVAREADPVLVVASNDPNAESRYPASEALAP